MVHLCPFCSTSTTEVYDDFRIAPLQQLERDQRAGADVPAEEREEHGELDQRRGAGDSAQLLTQEKAVSNARIVARN